MSFEVTPLPMLVAPDGAITRRYRVRCSDCGATVSEGTISAKAKAEHKCPKAAP